MIEATLWGLIAVYVATAIYVVRRRKKLVSKLSVAVLFLLPMLPTLYKQVVFRAACVFATTEEVFEPAFNVDSVIFKGSFNTEWVHYLAETGGYSVVEYARRFGSRVEYEQNYWNPSLISVRRRSSDTSTSRYQIERVLSRRHGFILENKLVASDLQSGRILGQKTILFLSAGGLSRYLHWKLENNMDAGGYTCPRITSTGKLLDFFPTKVLVAKPQ